MICFLRRRDLVDSTDSTSTTIESVLRAAELIVAGKVSAMTP